jgi:hypothetical protein
VIRNLPYWGVPRHDGFVLMPNEVEAYRAGPKAFEFKGTNGFMITWDISSKDVPAKTASAQPGAQRRQDRLTTAAAPPGRRLTTSRRSAGRRDVLQATTL